MKRTLFFLALAGISLMACKKENKNPVAGTTNNTPVNNTPAKKTYKVNYTIGCTDCNVLYYSDSLEDQKMQSHQNSSWTYTFYGRKGQNVVLEAYNTSSVSQVINVTIKLNDTTLIMQNDYCPISGDAFVATTIP